MENKINVHDSHLGKFNTASGRVMNLKSPDRDSINGWDISKGLAYTARFNGQCSHFYSVAQHSILVRHLAPQELKKAALIHDASEAYLGDVIKPLKVMLGRSYADIEERFMFTIAAKYGVLWKELEEVKYYDKMALELEHHAFQCGQLKEWSTYWRINLGAHEPAVWSPDYSFRKYSTLFASTFGEHAMGVSNQMLYAWREMEANRE
jgi:hypothetical protein